MVSHKVLLLPKVGPQGHGVESARAAALHQRIAVWMPNETPKLFQKRQRPVSRIRRGMLLYEDVRMRKPVNGINHLLLQAMLEDAVGRGAA